MGYRLRPFELAGGEMMEQEASKRLLRCLAIAAFAAMNIMLLSVAVWVGEKTDIDPATRDMFHGLSALIALPAAAFAGQPFFQSAFTALRARRLNMDVPISLGVTLALAMSVYEALECMRITLTSTARSCCSTFLLLGRYLDAAMRRKEPLKGRRGKSRRASRDRRLAGSRPMAGRQNRPRAAVAARRSRAGAPRRIAAGRRRGRQWRFRAG